MRTGRASGLTLWMLVAACLAMALAQPARAGTQDAPEIQDPANDQEVTAAGQSECLPQAGCEFSSGTDLLSGWVGLESATAVHFYFTTSSGCPGTINTYLYSVNFQIAGTSYVASATCNNLVEGENTPAGNGALAPGGVATSATLNDTVMDLAVPKSSIGNPAAGAVLTGFFITAQGTVSVSPVPFTDDRAPDDGNGMDYTFTGGAAPGGGHPGDTDGDGLNDTCETKYWGNLTAENNASADPDGDGLTNGQECALGTDPTKADTDGDGTNDKDDPYPTDPTRGGTNATSSSSSSSSSSTSSSHSSTTTAAASSHTKGAPKDFGEAMDRLKSDAGYLGLSSGGFLAVLVLCIIGLAVRWSL